MRTNLQISPIINAHFAWHRAPSRFMTDEWGQANESETDSSVPIRLSKA
jgi:hypothetical protein